MNNFDVNKTTMTSQQESKSIEEIIQESLIEARTTCSQHGNHSQECAVAWDIVEELQAEKSHRKQEAKVQTSLDYHCSLYPEADECRIYDV
jgi:CP12 domain